MLLSHIPSTVPSQTEDFPNKIRTGVLHRTYQPAPFYLFWRTPPPPSSHPPSPEPPTRPEPGRSAQIKRHEEYNIAWCWTVRS